MKRDQVAVVVFPGSNCDRDTLDALAQLRIAAQAVWYREELPEATAVVIPGGFSYGDYLRSGALASRSAIMGAIARRVAAERLPVLGICNGFQILTEAGLLPGALRVNRSGMFVSRWQTIRVRQAPPAWPQFAGERFRLPIAHREGAYTLPSAELAALYGARAVFLQYCPGDEPEPWSEYNPNGSDDDIAGIAVGPVIGLMPHPERAMAAYLGSADGRRFLSLWWEGRERARALAPAAGAPAEDGR